MKRLGYLWERFCAVPRAVEAIQEVVRGKTMRPAVVRKFGFPADPEQITLVAQAVVRQLEAGTWRFHPPTHIQKQSASSGKVRSVDCPCVIDQVVHWMIMLTLEPVLMRGMVRHNCGSIKGRGTKHGMETLQRWSREKRRLFYVKLDMKHYYQSIPHDRLKEALRRVIKDARMLALLDTLIDWFPTGLPLGNYTSQWLANFYLQPLDHYATEGLFKVRRGRRINYIAHYLRYMDDIILIGTSKHDLGKAVRAIIEKAATMGLTVKHCWEIKEWTNALPIDAMGFRIGRTYTEMRSYIALHARRKAKRCVEQRRQQGEIHPRTASGMMSLMGWVDRTDSALYREKYILPYVRKSELREVVSNESKRRHAIIKCARIAPS